MNTHNLPQEEESLASTLESFLQEMMDLVSQETAEKEPSTKAGRKPILPSIMLWSAVLVGLLRGYSSQAAIWRLISWKGFWKYPEVKVSDQAVYDRLAAKGDDTLQRVFVAIRDGLKSRLEPMKQRTIAPFASEVYAIDGSTLDKMMRHLPKLWDVPNGDRRLLPGKMVGLFDIRRQIWQEMIHLPNPDQNDKAVAYELVKGLPQNSLILADMGFFGFKWFDQLTEAKIWWISRFRHKTTFEVIHTFYQDGDLFDGIIWLGRYRADKAAHAVRLVTFTVGQTHHRYLTNVLDPKQLSLHDIAVLYARRWDIELAFKLVKQHLKLHLIWSGHPQVVLQQLWGTLIISQILQASRLEIAFHSQVDPFDVSIDLLAQYLPSLAYEGKDPFQMIIDDGRRVGFIRPSRRIRPKTPPVDHLSFEPLPDRILLQRKPRYAQRRCQTSDFDKLGATKASDTKPLLC